MIRPSHITEDRIRELAYRLWLEDGQPQGKSGEHWEKARDLLALGTDSDESRQGLSVESAAVLDSRGRIATDRNSSGKRRSALTRQATKRRPL